MSAKKKTEKKKADKPRRSGWAWRMLRGLLLTLTVVASAGLIVASYGGDFHPAEFRGLCIMVMLFPVWAFAVVVLTVLDALWCRKALIVCVITYILCATALWEFSPLNLFTPDKEDYPANRQFKFITYNCCNLADRYDDYPDGTNPSVSFLLRENADVVCLQELMGIQAYKKSIKLPQSQVDSLYKAYPYIYLNGHSQMLLSKYPAKAIPTERKSGQSEIAVFQLMVEGMPITLINTHLQSYGLTADDKQVYREMTQLSGSDSTLTGNLLNVKMQLLHKIQSATELRADDAERIGEFIHRFGGPNVIVAGDFNDVPCSYVLRRLKDFGMKQVYEEVGFGSRVSYYEDRFYFRIDHVLYRGKLKPLDIEFSDHDSSDHAPLIVTFALTDD